MERDKGVFDPKGVVANSTVPRKVVTAAKSLMGIFTRAPMAAALMALQTSAVKRLPFTQEERDVWAREYRAIRVYGRNFFKARASEPLLNGGGPREVARRQRQIAAGKLHPIYRA
jgi:hypothetical protein